MFCVHHF